MKKVNLKWYAICEDFNHRGNLEHYNVLEGLEEPIAKEIRAGHISNRAELKKWLKAELMFNYWSKCEFEIVVGFLFSDKEHKIDVWYQLEPNLDRIVEYVEREMEIEWT